MKFLVKSLVAVIALSAAFASNADNYDQVKQKLQASLSLSILSIADAPVPGLIQVNTDRGLFYASEDGKYFMRANIYNLDAQMRNETEVALTSIRLDGLKDFADDVIEFKAENEKYVVNVFTDITCGYCRKLHNEIAEYNDAGITVRYLAFPRGGLNSAGYQDMVSVWCAEDKQDAMTTAKAGSKVANSTCANSVAEQYRFGQRVGVTGTPNIILSNGTVIPGYQPAKVLEQVIKDNS